MKTRLLQTWRLGVLALAISAVSGCVADSEADTRQTPSPVTNSVAAGDTINAVADAVAEIPENAEPPERAEPSPGSENRPLPADLKLSPGTSEIARLARAGLNETVLLAFVTNSAGTFNLGSEQIVYLNDLGLASDVITAMIEHDRLLREGLGTLPPLAAVNTHAAQAAPTDAAAVAAAAAPQALPEMVEAAAEPPPPPATTEAVPPPPANVTYNYFHDSLAPYGTWLDVDGYGSCWQPSVVVVNAGWRPYSHGGRWIYSDYGWYWHSDYSWGWAPFHYGRWFSHPRWGWCWRPDTIWGPSWVSWRYTDAYCGWSPLPPAAYYSSGVGFTYYGSSVGLSFGFGLGWSSYSFVPWGHFRDHRPYRHCAPPHHARDIYHNSTVINNVIVGNNNRIINRGIGEDHVRRYTGTELKPVRVREERVAGQDSRLTPGDRLERGGRELVIRRPQLPQTPPTAPELTKGIREAPRTASTASFSERRSSFPARDPRAPSLPGTPGGAPDGTAPGKRVPAAGSLTQDGHRETALPGETTARGPGSAPTRPATELAKRPLRPGPATVPAAPPAPPRPEPSVAKRETPQPNPVITFGRRDSTPVAPASTPSRAVPRSPGTPGRANTTSTWTKPEENRANLAVNTPQRAPAFTQPTRPSPSPGVEPPATPVAPRTMRPETPRLQPAPAPSVRYEPRMAAPPAPTPPQAIVRPSSPPTYSAPPSRPSPSFTPSPAPSAPRSSPGPSFTPAPSAPRSAPSPPPSSSGSADRSGGGRGGSRER